ncbi:MAG: hypothetical protein JJ908_09340 [Rhizobiales bacterium]|nr:hypothetical protein [Hyphomicrobiales bacterium]MBO6699023.1 hypothetical protein [Hyphomicrobiales bacterium]MBO6736561.1 hypothetical protein [Hyphomicrobiales bacterium]MBO6912365.1 hypothetical protein [Hyphomicrobiales bacterium]MBO6956273.1 hypothetical protein [Hyphomicrobiales bacterium]
MAITEKASSPSVVPPAPDGQHETVNKDQLAKQRTDVLRQSSSDAQILIRYLSEQGVVLDPDFIQKILSFTSKLEKGTIDHNEETQFWQSYSRLTNYAKPANIDALRFSGSKWKNNGEKQAKLYLFTLNVIGIFSAIIFIIVVATLAFVSVSESTINNSENALRETFLLERGITVATAIETLVAGLESASEGNDQAVSALVADRKAQVQQLMLYNFDLTQTLLRSDIEIQPGESLDQALRDQISNLKNVVSLISGFALPVLTSLLGVCVYILRSGSNQIERMSFRPESVGVYFYRVILGVTGGIAISWFIPVDETGLLASIAPATLAFLVGYAVEILFNVMDSLVRALGGPQIDGRTKVETQR